MSETLRKARESLLLRLRLAKACEIRNENKKRDQLLVLAGADARRLGWNPIAAQCRREIIAHNAGHMLHRYRSFAEALEHEDFIALHERLQRKFPVERMEHLLAQVNMPEEPRVKLSDDLEYAAMLLGTSREELESAEREPPIEPAVEEPFDAATIRWGLAAAVALVLTAAAWLVWWLL